MGIVHIARGNLIRRALYHKRRRYFVRLLFCLSSEALSYMPALPLDVLPNKALYPSMIATYKGDLHASSNDVFHF